MQERGIFAKVLLTHTLRLLAQFALLVGLLAIACTATYLAFGFPNAPAIIFAVAFALLYLSAPLAAASVRASRGLGIFTRAGGTAFMFCFAWGAAVAVGFVASLQFWQGMSATFLNYLVAMGAAGAVCAAATAMPGRY